MLRKSEMVWDLVLTAKKLFVTKQVKVYTEISSINSPLELF